MPKKSIASKIVGKIRSFFGRKPAKPKVVGHRGIAAGNLKRPDLEDYSERVSRDVGVKIGADEVQDFLDGGNPIFVHSSNVLSAQYYPEAKKMQVEFKGGRAYLYDNISKDEALSFATAQSKGDWVWSTLRVRGSKTKHRKPYVRVK